MIIVTPQMLAQFQSDDWVAKQLATPKSRADDHFTIQRWLRDTPPKRLVFDALYGDLFKVGPRCSVLDVGGGFSYLSRALVANHDYDLLEISAHDDAAAIHQIGKTLGRDFFIEKDWATFTPERSYDLIIANDLFPNVDQRLTLFIERFLPHARELRLSLTFYNTPRSYATKRVDADEVLYLLAYDGAHTALALAPWKQLIDEKALGSLKTTKISVYPNGRHVALLTLKGGKA